MQFETSMEFTLSEVFNYFSGFLGLLLSIVVVTIWKGNKNVKLTLTLVLVIVPIIVLLGAMNYSGKIRDFPHLIRVDNPIHFLLGPALYFLTVSYFKEDFRFRPIHLINLIPFLLTLLYFLPFYFSSKSVKLDYYNGFMLGGSVIIQKLYLIKAIAVWLYLFGEIYIFFKYAYQDWAQNQKGRHDVTWFVVFFIIQFICWSGFLFDHLTNLKTFPDPYQFALNMVSLVLITISLTLLFYPKLLYGLNSSVRDTHDKYSYSNLSEKEKERILSDWMTFIHGEKKPFLDPKLSLRHVAQLLHTNPQRLSQVINEKSGKSFNDFINSKRVDEAIKILASEELTRLTIEGIALKSGFHSKSPFYKAFKKRTGLTPRQYLNSN